MVCLFFVVISNCVTKKYRNDKLLCINIQNAPILCKKCQNHYPTFPKCILICTPKVRQTEGVYIFMGRKKKINAKYSPEFKISVIMDMRKNHLGYMETVRKYWGKEINANNYYHRVQRWERIYLEEGEAGFYIERRGRTKKVDNPNKGRPRKKPLGKKIREDLIAENQRLKEENQYLKAEMEYLKKLDALIRAEEQKNGKNRK